MSFLSRLFGKNKISAKSNKSTDSISEVNVLGKYFNLTDLMIIPLGEILSLVPIDAKSIDGMDKIMLETLSQTPRIKKYIPQLDFSNPNNSSEKFFTRLVLQTENGLGFSYGLYINNGLAGMIMVETPEYNKLTIGFEHWTFSFFSLMGFEQRGLMSASLPRFLHYMKENIGVKELYAIVDADNTRSIRLLQKFMFDEVDNSGWEEQGSSNDAPKVFSCNLSTINFRG